MPSLPTVKFRLLAWLAALILLGATVIAPGASVHAWTTLRPDDQGTVSAATQHAVALLAAPTLTAKAAPVRLSWRGHDLSSLPVAFGHHANALAGRAVNSARDRDQTRRTRPTLVGVVELRI